MTNSKYIIKRLNEKDKEKIIEHFLRLDSSSLYSRFCGTTSPEYVSKYVERMNFEKDGIFGVFNTNLDIIGLGECAISLEHNNAEIGFTVEEEHRGQGLANKIMARLIRFSKANNNSKLEMYCLRNNKQSIAIAKKFGLDVYTDMTEATAKIDLNDNIPSIENLTEKIENSFSEMAIQQQKTFNNVKLGQHLFISTMEKLSQINPFFKKKEEISKKQPRI